MEDSIFEEITILEKELISPEIRGSVESLAELLTDDFVEFCSSGEIVNKAQTIDSLSRGETVLINSDGFKGRELAEGLVLLTYVSTDNKTGTMALRSSIWKFTDGKWRMTFHQGTRIPK